MLGEIQKCRKETLNINKYSLEMYTTHQLYYDKFNNRNFFFLLDLKFVP